jgi:anti-sigma regulatory factor (Ser/Thr protein kinase)
MTDVPAEPAAPVAVDLPDDRTAASVAREQTRTVLRGWRLPTLLDPLLLVVSELVGNAVRHGRPPVAMLLRRTRGGVRVEVHDEDATAPAKGQGLPGEAAESGRGTFLVEAVSDETGVEQIPGDGKVVWATVTDDDTRNP